jgi:hypothetical protein
MQQQPAVNIHLSYQTSPPHLIKHFGMMAHAVMSIMQSHGDAIKFGKLLGSAACHASGGHTFSTG